ncbi:MAG: NRAMP family divalent metal transporter [Pyrinomonadaceae bacterium]
MTDSTPKKGFSGVMIGAAFLMATSAVGPGFLTQTAKFTADLAASFGFVILASVVIDVVAQLNIWRILAISGKRGQDLANETFFGSGYLLSGLIAMGGVVFNIGNVAGAGLGLNAFTGIPVWLGALVSSVIALLLFSFRDASKAMDLFVRVLGFVMIALILFVVFVSQPPIGDAVMGTIWPDKLSPLAIITLVGGTVGGYITFAGAHRLIDAGVTGKECLKEVNRSATLGIFVTGAIRFLLFLAAFGVVASGLQLDPSNPPASVFKLAAGDTGMRIFGIVMWSAAITSIVGASYTSVSFLKTFPLEALKRERLLTMIFIVVSGTIFLLIGNPVKVLVAAGTVNGFVLPFGLGITLLAVSKGMLPTDYKHSIPLKWLGWAVVLTMLGFSVFTLPKFAGAI